MSRSTAGVLDPPAVAEDPDVAGRVRALEARVRRMEQTAARAVPDPDELATCMEELAVLAAEDVVRQTVEGLRAVIAAEVATVRADAGAAADSIRRDVSALVERQAHLVRRELAQDVAEARGELRRAFTASTPRPYVRGQHYDAGEQVVHRGAVWTVVAARGSAGEEPGGVAASWLLTADGVAGVETRLDDGALVADIRMASGRTFTSKMPDATPTYAGPFSQGRTYRRMQMVHRDGSLWMAARETAADPRHSDASGGWVLVSARGEKGSGPSAGQMTLAENFITSKLADEGTRRERLADTLAAADDFWRTRRAAQRHGDTVLTFAELSIAEGIVVVAGESARPAATELAARVGHAVLQSSREAVGGGGEPMARRAQEVIRELAGLLLPQGRAERLLDLLLQRNEAVDRPLVAGLRAMVGAR